jgi:glutathione peroxidase
LDSFYDLDLKALDGSDFPTADLRDKAVLFVNVASKCGFTKQYTGLQELYTRYADQGLVIVGVPCNQFGGQEPGSSEDIAGFCQLNYGVDFPLLEKQKVNGKDRSPLYQYLVKSDAGGGGRILWNFSKFLVGKDGQVQKRYGSKTRPEDTGLIADIQAALGSD